MNTNKNKILVFAMLSVVIILSMFAVSAEQTGVMHFTQKNLDTWVSYGTTADVTYSVTENIFSATGVPSEYTLVYYPNVGTYDTYTGIVYPVTGSLPMSNDLNGGSSSNYCTINNSNGTTFSNPNAIATGVCQGAKLWLVQTSNLTNNPDGTFTITDWNTAAPNILFETALITFTSTSAPVNLAPVNLGTAGDFVILAKTGVSTTGTTSVVGDIGLSPAAASYITGFDLIADSTNTFSTSSLVTGKIYAADYTPPTPINMGTSVSDMETAYTDAAGRTLPNFLNAGTGELGGLTLTPGLYKFTTDVKISNDITFDAQGDSNAVFIFQIPGTLDISTNKKIILSGGAQAKNIFWQVADAVTLQAGSHFEGIILAKTNIAMITGATLNGRALAQTAVTLDANAVTFPNAVIITPPVVTPPETNTETHHSGGGSSCVTKWTCAEWNTCADGTQTRTCSYPTNWCKPTYSKPVLTQSCTTIVTPEPTITDTETPSSTDTGTPSGITGGVIGARTTAGKIGIAFLILLIGLLVAGIIVFLVRSFSGRRL